MPAEEFRANKLRFCEVLLSVICFFLLQLAITQWFHSLSGGRDLLVTEAMVVVMSVLNCSGGSGNRIL